MFSTQISSAGLTEGAPEAGIGGIPGGKIIPGGGGRFPMGGGRKGGLCNKHYNIILNLLSTTFRSRLLNPNTIAASTRYHMLEVCNTLSADFEDAHEWEPLPEDGEVQ